MRQPTLPFPPRPGFHVCPHPLGHPLDVLGADNDPGQGLQIVPTFLERLLAADPRHHPPQSRRAGRAHDVQLLIPRIQRMFAHRAFQTRPPIRNRPQNGHQNLAPQTPALHAMPAVGTVHRVATPARADALQQTAQGLRPGRQDGFANPRLPRLQVRPTLPGRTPQHPLDLPVLLDGYLGRFFSWPCPPPPPSSWPNRSVTWA